MSNSEILNETEVIFSSLKELNSTTQTHEFFKIRNEANWKLFNCELRNWVKHDLRKPLSKEYIHETFNHVSFLKKYPELKEFTEVLFSTKCYNLSFKKSKEFTSFMNSKSPNVQDRILVCKTPKNETFWNCLRIYQENQFSLNLKTEFDDKIVQRSDFDFGNCGN